MQAPVATACAFLFLSIQVAAQVQSLPAARDADPAGSDVRRSAPNGSAPRAGESLPMAAPLPLPPETFADRKFWWLTAGTVGTAAADIYTTRQGRANGCQERNPLAPSGLGPSIAVKGVAIGANAVLAWWLRRKAKSYWWVPQASLSVAQGAATALNARCF